MSLYAASFAFFHCLFFSSKIVPPNLSRSHAFGIYIKVWAFVLPFNVFLKPATPSDTARKWRNFYVCLYTPRASPFRGCFFAPPRGAKYSCFCEKTLRNLKTKILPTQKIKFFKGGKMPRGRVANTMATFTEIPISHSAKELSLINYHQKVSRVIKQIIKKKRKKKGRRCQGVG